jgi:hypothetical protein
MNSRNPNLASTAPDLQATRTVSSGQSTGIAGIWLGLAQRLCHSGKLQSDWMRQNRGSIIVHPTVFL